MGPGRRARQSRSLARAPPSPSRGDSTGPAAAAGERVVSRTRGLVLSNRILFARASPELPGPGRGAGWDGPGPSARGWRQPRYLLL